MKKVILSERALSFLKDKDARQQLSTALDKVTSNRPGTVEHEGKVYQILGASPMSGIPPNEYDDLRYAALVLWDQDDEKATEAADSLYAAWEQVRQLPKEYQELVVRVLNGEYLTIVEELDREDWKKKGRKVRRRRFSEEEF